MYFFPKERKTIEAVGYDGERNADAIINWIAANRGETSSIEKELGTDGEVLP